MGKNIVKQYIQNRIHLRRLKEYEEMLHEQKDAYHIWMYRMETRDDKKLISVPSKPVREKEAYIIPYESAEFSLIENKGHKKEKLFLFCEDGGMLSKTTIDRILAFMDKKEISLCPFVYGDEDVIDGTGQRKDPWFKPGWSPETASSFFYFGSLVGVRPQAVEEVLNDPAYQEYISRLSERKGREFLYGLCLLLAADGEKKNSSPMLLDEILYHAKEKTNVFGREESYTEIKKLYFSLVGQEVTFRPDQRGGSYPVFPSPEGKVSILIPSKDHPEVLLRCVDSLTKVPAFSKQDSKKAGIEIVVVDNGSNDENRARYEDLSQKYGFAYHYQPQTFNFSKMCNTAAELSKGEYLLFLNDDVEIVEEGWLSVMLGTAALKEVAAVGAKLYYPGGKILQHAGVTNLYSGPTHKMQRQSDEVICDRGRNLGVWNMIGVTAACLLIERKKFDAVGGFDTGLAVAYNDVDLCFRLHRAGYRNVQRNDVILYHHESLSRGDDRMDDAKMKRLRAEWTKLYGKNEGYFNYDPYYNKNLTGVSDEYECCRSYELWNLNLCKDIREVRDESLKQSLSKEGLNQTLILNADFVGKEFSALEKKYVIDIHAHVRGLDSADYDFRMFLKSKEQVFEIPVMRQYRPDIPKIYYNELHVDLSGFFVRIPPGIVKSGEYEIWMEAKCALSRQRLYNRLEETLIVE